MLQSIHKTPMYYTYRSLFYHLHISCWCSENRVVQYVLRSLDISCIFFLILGIDVSMLSEMYCFKIVLSLDTIDQISL